MDAPFTPQLPHPTPSSPPQTESTQPFLTQGGRPLIDLDDAPPSFHKSNQMNEFDKHKDVEEEEFDEVMREFEKLATEFELWSIARIKSEEAKHLDTLHDSTEKLAKEEKAQETERSRISGFFESFKSALGALTRNRS